MIHISFYLLIFFTINIHSIDRSHHFSPLTTTRIDPSKLDIFTHPPPRAFYFRKDSNVRKTDPHLWQNTMRRLDGYMANAIGENGVFWEKELTIPMTRLKTENPFKLVNVHFAERERARSQCASQGSPYFAGHWLHYPGSILTTKISITDTEIDIKDIEPFKEALKYNATDIALCSVDKSNVHNWKYAEELVLLSVNSAESTIKVKRGQHNSTAFAFDSGSYVAPHAYSAHTPNQWAYNYATTGPLDENNHSAVDIQLEEWRKWIFGDSKDQVGPFYNWTGISFDVSYWHVNGVNKGKFLHIDANDDGIADDGIVDGVEVYGMGQLEFHRRLRDMLGNKYIIVAKGQHHETQRSVDYINGIEHEGFPCDKDWGILDWGGAINRLLFWNITQREKSNFLNFNHIIMKWPQQPEKPLISSIRVVLAAAVVTDSVISIGDILPKPDKKMDPYSIFGLWDELRKGVSNLTHWLGWPLVDVQQPRLGLTTTDLLQEIGCNVTNTFLNMWHSKTGATFDRYPHSSSHIFSPDWSLRIAGPGTDSKAYMNATFSLEFLPIPVLNGNDLLVSFDISAIPRTPLYEAGVPRLIWVQLLGSALDPQEQWTAGKGQQMALVGQVVYRAVFYFRDVQWKDVINGENNCPLNLRVYIEGTQAVYIRNMTIHNAPDLWARQFENGAVLINPSSKPQHIDISQAFFSNGDDNISLCRLKGVKGQDPITNNGKSIGTNLTLPALDALFLTNC